MHQSSHEGRDGSASLAERGRLCEQLGVDQTVTTAKAAELLDMHVMTLYRWGSKGEGPLRPVRVGRQLRWSVADIRALLNGARPSDAAPSSEPAPAPAAP